MRVLVCIASYGFKNESYLHRLIDEYSSMSFDVRIIVVSDRIKNLGKNVTVIVGLPSKNPHSLPFSHKQVFIDNLKLYDLFVYSEDDILITERNIKTFLEITERLPDKCISGFLRYEQDGDGNKYCPDAETRFHWVLNSVEEHQGEEFAIFSNDHSASYVLTKIQLKKCIESGGYAVPPHEGDYDLECSAATDPYTQCGFRRLICISRLSDIVLHHLPNRYIGCRGISFEEMNKQIGELKASYLSGKKDVSLFPTKKNVSIRDWDKQYYEEIDRDIIEVLKGPNQQILSIGAGSGGLEEAIRSFGHYLVAIPIDNVMAASLQHRHIEVTKPNFEVAFKQLRKRIFNCVILPNVLQHVDDPEKLLESVIKLLSEKGTIIVKIHNFNFFRWKTFRPKSYKESQLNCLDIKKVDRLFKKKGFNVFIKPQGSEKVESLFRLIGPIMSSQLARSYVMVASKKESPCFLKNEKKR